MNIFAFGDSTTYGCWDSEGGWISRIRKYADKKNAQHIVYNLGIGGGTTRTILERFEREYDSRGEEGEDHAIIFGTGKNDSALYRGEKGRNIVSPNDFQNNLKQLIEIGRRKTSKLTFVSLLPVEEAKTMPVWWDTDYFYTNEQIRTYNELLAAVLGTENIPLVDVHSKLNGNVEGLLADGLHPNDQGHEILFKKVLEFIEKEKWLK